MESAADAFGESMVALLLSGANEDGVTGLKAVKESGGLVVVQDPQTAEVPYMPQYAIKHVAVDVVLADNQTETFMNLFRAHA
jgi:two-component system, chemotaxis family, protein-glutamate methylesterase/glutaminase